MKTLLAAVILFAAAPIAAAAATLSASPSFVSPGGAVTATWSAIAAPTLRDWIGLYSTSAADTNFIDWIFVNTCNKSGGATAPVSGSCPFPTPGSIPNGSYELRLFSNNGYGRLATSSTLVVAPQPPPRFVDNGDGTVTDRQLGLMWAKKTGIKDVPVACLSVTDCSDSHNVNNVYRWSDSGVAGDGSLFTNFVERINGYLCDSVICPRGFAGYSDWRIPTYGELDAIYCGNCGSCGLSFSAPCIQPLLANSSGLAQTYWTSSTFAPNLPLAFVVNFRLNEVPPLVCGQQATGPGFKECISKGAALPAFAVRGGPQER